jgi:CubicO group peptidase (beta-lactamase class C family)/peptidoglycan/LPS O-acetylase OafA/YrhL
MTAVLSGPSDAPTVTAAGGRAKSGSGRDGFLDAVRGIAVMRVVVWHTFATALISWSIASMPAMFFVAGSLLAQSLDRRRAIPLLRQRLKRLLLPFWVFSGVVLTVLVMVHRADGTASTALSPAKLLPWIFPLADPRGSAWEAGWVSTPLWYLRCYLWLLLLAPLLRKVYRVAGLIVVAVPIAGALLIDWVVRHPDAVSPAIYDLRWYLGDLATYSTFLIFGFAHRDGVVDRLSRRDRLEWGFIGLAGALLWMSLVEVPGNVVNNSYPMLLMVGLFWLMMFLAAEPWIASLTTAPGTRPLFAWLGRRSMTVYLWHTTAIVGAYWLRSNFFPEAPAISVLPFVALGTVVLATLFGWVEDLSAGKKPRALSDFGSRRNTRGLGGVMAGLAIGAVLIGFVIPAASEPAAASEKKTNDGGGLALPPAPSAKPDQAVFEPEAEDDVTPPVDSVVEANDDASPDTSVVAPTEDAEGAIDGDPAAAPAAASLQQAVDTWRSDLEVDGVVIGVATPDGARQFVVSGAAKDGEAMTADQVVPVTSITKTFTSALIMQFVAEGKIALDDPLPPLDAAPDFPFTGQVTIRQLLMHTSGVRSYNDVAAYASLGEVELTPAKALELSATEPLQWIPGTASGYSSTGYITLGLLAEQLGGAPYAELVQQRLVEPAGLTVTSLDTTPRDGWLGYSAGGLQSSVEDILTWGTALYRDGGVLGEPELAAVVDIENEFSAGLGSFPVCPCSIQDGKKVYTSIGHHGGQVSVQYSPSDDLVIVVSLSESMWTASLNQADVAKLFAAIRTAVNG